MREPEQEQLQREGARVRERPPQEQVLAQLQREGARVRERPSQVLELGRAQLRRE